MSSLLFLASSPLPSLPLSLYHLVKRAVDTGDYVSHQRQLRLSPTTPGGQASLCVAQAYRSANASIIHITPTTRLPSPFGAPSEIGSSAPTPSSNPGAQSSPLSCALPGSLHCVCPHSVLCSSLESPLSITRVWPLPTRDCLVPGEYLMSCAQVCLTGFSLR